MTEKEVLEDFINSEHYKLSQEAAPIIERMRCLLPKTITTNGLKFTVMPRSVSTIGSLEYKYNRVTRIPISYELKVSKYLLEPNMKSILRETLIHELAHYFAIKWKGLGEASHGFYWGYIMIALGREPNKYTTYGERSAVKQAKVRAEMLPFKYSECSTCKKTSMAELKDGKYICEVCGNEVDEA